MSLPSLPPSFSVAVLLITSADRVIAVWLARFQFGERSIRGRRRSCGTVGQRSCTFDICKPSLSFATKGVCRDAFFLPFFSLRLLSRRTRGGTGLKPPIGSRQHQERERGASFQTVFFPPLPPVLLLDKNDVRPSSYIEMSERPFLQHSAT